VSADRDIPQFCYNSCYECGEEVKILFRLGMGDTIPNPEGVWLAGGGNFDVPGGKYEMHDDDLDGIYEVLVPRRRNFSSFYAYANGPCPDYSCKENLTGQPCGDPNNFNDRFLPVVEADTEISNCYGSCLDASCTTSTITPQKDANVFNLNGNPSGIGYSVLDFGDDRQSEKHITLSNSLGQVIRQWVVADGSSTFEIQTSEPQAGIYMVTVKVGNRFYTRKLVH
jgi:hypothetical protein